MSASRLQAATLKRSLSNIRSQSSLSKIDGLKTISEMLAIGNPASLTGFPLSECCKDFVRILQKDTSGDVLEAVTQCIVNVLDCYPTSSQNLMSLNFLRVIKEKLPTTLTIRTIENLVHSVSALTKSRAKDIGQILGISKILRFIPTFCPPEQRYAIAGIARITNSFFLPKFAKAIPLLSSLFSFVDQTVVNDAISSFLHILDNLPLDRIPLSVIPDIAKASSVASDGATLLRLLALALKLIPARGAVDAFLAADLNYHRLLRSADFGREASDVSRAALQLISRFLPDPDFPPGFWERIEREIPANPAAAAAKFADLLASLVANPRGSLELVLVNWAMALSATGGKIPPQVLPVLIGVSRDARIAPFSLLVCLHSGDAVGVKSSGLLAALSQIAVSEPLIAAWYREKLAELNGSAAEPPPASQLPNPRIYLDFPTILEFVNHTEISPFDFDSAGYCDRILQVIDRRNDFGYMDLTKLRDILFQLLIFGSFPEVANPFRAQSSIEFAKGKLLVDIKCGEKTFPRKHFANESLLVGIEAWYNETVLRVTSADLVKAARLHNDIILLDNVDKFALSQLGLLHRVYRTPRYKTFAFKIDTRICCYLDFLFQNIVRGFESPELFQTVVPTVELIEDIGNESLSPMDVPSNNLPRKVILDILSKLQNVRPDLDWHCPEYERVLRPFLSSFFMVVGLYSPAVQAAVHYPFLFSTDFRTLIFRLISADFFSALSLAHKQLFQSTEKLREGRMFCHCLVRRTHLFEDGLRLLRTIARGPVQLDIRFDGERGFGSGPTREFFGALAKEFCRKSARMWRTDLNEQEFAFTETGLFPAPNADPELFFAFGILCAKAVSVNMVLPVFLSIAFFKFVRGDEIELAEVDSGLARVFEGNRKFLNGLMFVYPGYDDIELEPGGSTLEVNKLNVYRYVQLVKQFTYGSYLNRIKQRFLDGFATIFKPGIIQMLNATEFRRMVIGDEVSITMEELQSSVEVTHGYTAQSEQIGVLFEIIVELSNSDRSLFVKFITGAERLPIGGISALQPRLTIARRIGEDGENPDMTLPSVMTCTNYLKLPAYSSKDVMKEKVLLAIREGQEGFLLT